METPLLNRDDNILPGALDTLAVALSDHYHVWTEGEREIYEQAVGMLLPNESTHDVGGD